MSTAHPLATRAGIAVLERGGNAFDAAVAIAATLTVVEPMNSSLFGGYGTILLWDAGARTLRYLDNNGRFPLAVDSDVFRAVDDPESLMRDARAVSTPGNLAGFEMLWREQGSLPWDSLLAGAIELADDGFEVSPALARAIEGTWGHFSDYTRAFYGKDGAPLEAGDRLVQKDLAASLRLAAGEGSNALYHGELGQAVEREMKRRGGFLTLADLEAHRSEWLQPISIDYRGVRVVTAGPPSNSFAELVCLGIMSRYDLTGLDPGGADYLHRFAEATKHAYWARLRYAGGPEENPPPLERLLSETYWQEQAERFDPGQASDFEPPSLAREGESTTHFVVADSSGNVVSATITLGHTFGSAVMVEGTGIWLNNSLAYSTFRPKGNPMDALPGRRKHSSKSPTLLMRNDRPWIALGTPGGHTIPQTNPQLVIQLVDFRRDLEQALAAPRIAFATPGDALLVERAVAPDVQEALAKLGHTVRLTDAVGNAQMLRVDYDDIGNVVGFSGAADPRGEGLAAVAERRVAADGE